MKFGEKLKKIRIDQGLSQRQVGERLNVSQQTIAQYERAVFPPKAKTMDRLASALELSPEELWLRTSTYPDRDKEILKQLDGITPNDVFSLNEAILIPLIKELNDKGLSKTYKYISDLLKIPEYTKDGKPYQNDAELLAAHARTDVEQTSESVQHDLDIMNNDSEWD